MHRLIAGFCQQQWRRNPDCCVSSTYYTRVFSALFRWSTVRSDISLAAIWQRDSIPVSVFCSTRQRHLLPFEHALVT